MNISQHSLVLPILPYVAGQFYVSNSGNLVASSSEVHTSGKIMISSFIPAVNSFHSFRGSLPSNYANVKTFITNSTNSQSNGYRVFTTDSPRTGIDSLNYVAIMSSLDNFYVTTIMWFQLDSSPSLLSLNYLDSLNFQNDNIL